MLTQCGMMMMGINRTISDKQSVLIAMVPVIFLGSAPQETTFLVEEEEDVEETEVATEEVTEEVIEEAAALAVAQEVVLDVATRGEVSEVQMIRGTTTISICTKLGKTRKTNSQICPHFHCILFPYQ